MTKIMLTYEIMGAMSPSVSESLRSGVMSSIDATVTKVSNSDKEVHLALPYYSGLEQAASNAVQDTDLDDVAGGELFAVIAGIVTAVIGGTAAAGVGISQAVKENK